MRSVVLGFTAVFIVLTSAAAAVWSYARTPAPIRIGVLHSLSGTMAISERSLVDAATMAVEEINAAGGVMGRPIEIVIADGQSDPVVFAAEAERLITQEQVVALFGTWTSVSRKAVKDVVEKFDHLLFYPLQYEGLEASDNIVYLGAAPNQQILPAVRWSLTNLGPRFYLVGSDYLFPRAANAIITDQLSRWPAEIVGEDYLLLGSRDVDRVVASIKAAKPDVVLNTINGDTNVAFYQAMLKAGLTAGVVPTVSFSIAEEEMRQLPADAMTGHYAAWTYFQSLPGAANQQFVQRFQRRFGSDRVTDDPIESAYVAVRLFADAAAAAESTEPGDVRAAVRERAFDGPGGFVFVDGVNQHAWKTVRIGRIRNDGQFDVVWSSAHPIPPAPFPPLRPPEAWATFLDTLQRGWGGRWENPGPANR
jgi:urea transport system substrate-binding protein